MRMIDKSLTESIYTTIQDSMKSNHKTKKHVIKESSNVVWSSSGNYDYYNSLSDDKLRKEYKDMNYEDISDAELNSMSRDELLDYIIPEDAFDYDAEDFRESVLPRIEEQCYGDVVVLFGRAANWRGSGDAAKVTNLGGFTDMCLTDDEATVNIVSNDGKLGYYFADHDVPTGYTVNLYSFKDEGAYNKAEERIQEINEDEDFSMYYFEDYADYNIVKDLIDNGILTPIVNNISESVMLNTGSTTVTSDETGVTIEDNGNTITVGNGVTVDIDNEADVLPAEMDIASIEEPVQDTSIEDRVINKEIKESAELTAKVTYHDEDGTRDYIAGKLSDGRYFLIAQQEQIIISDKDLPSLAKKDMNDFRYDEDGDKDFIEALENGTDLDKNSDLAKVIIKASRKYLDDGGYLLSESDAINDSLADDLDESTTEEQYGTKELARQAFVSLQKSEDSDGTIEYIIMNDGRAVERINASSDDEAINIFNNKYQKLQDKNIQEATQTIDIFQNPEFDYKITDITSLKNVSSGDVRPIDMNGIILGLDESLAKRYGSDKYVTFDYYEAKKGKDYSSAIINISFPGSHGGYACIFESSYNDGVYTCVAKPASKLCGEYIRLNTKTTNPIKAFEESVVELINLRNLAEACDSLDEDVVLVNNSKPDVEDENGVTYTNIKRVLDSRKRRDTGVKSREKLLKKSKKFNVEEEPDQKNTSGKSIEDKKAIKESDDDIVTKANQLKEKIDNKSEDIENLTIELLDLANEIDYRGILDVILPMDIAKEAIANEMQKDFDNGKSMLLTLDDTDDSYVFVDGYGKYKNIDYDLLDTLAEELLDNMSSLNESEDTDVSEDNLINNEEKIYDVYTMTQVGPNEYKSELYNTVYSEDQAVDTVNELRAQTGANAFYKEREANKKIEESSLKEEDSPILGSGSAIFHRKPNNVSDMKAEEDNGITVNKSSYVVIAEKNLSKDEFEDFANNLLMNRYDWLKDLYNTEGISGGSFKCIRVTGDDENYALLVDPSGYDYARYVAFDEEPNFSVEDNEDITSDVDSAEITEE